MVQNHSSSLIKKKILIICGEPSGDLHASNLIKNILIKNPEIKISAIAGTHSKQHNIELIYDIKNLAFMGFFEILKNLKTISDIKKYVCKNILIEKYDAVILIDYPGFNISIAQFCYLHNIPVIYYICPQIWAWHYSRIYKLVKYCKKLLVIFKFEEDLYKKVNGNVQFVGHPVLDKFNNYKLLYGVDEIFNSDKKNIIALLPGSRQQEIEKLLAYMIEIAELSKERLKNFKFVVSFLNKDLEENFKYMLPSFIEYYTGDMYDILANSYFALTASGTAALETALFGVPMFVLYKVNFISAVIAKLVIKIPHISLVNIVLNKKIVSEYLQWDLKSDIISNDMINLINDNSKYMLIREELLKLNNILQPPPGYKSASEYAADIITDFLNQNSNNGAIWVTN